MTQADQARQLARDLLEGPMPSRWAHTQGVARKAQSLSTVLGDDADLVEAAAWLHDIGYAPGVVNTGFHPLDGARYLRDVAQTKIEICRLVARHSYAAVEAEERDLAVDLDWFIPLRPELHNALTYCDMTTGADGRPVTLDQRLAEILSRPGQDHVVIRAARRAAPRLSLAISTTESLLSGRPKYAIDERAAQIAANLSAANISSTDLAALHQGFQTRFVGDNSAIWSSGSIFLTAAFASPVIYLTQSDRSWPYLAAFLLISAFLLVADLIAAETYRAFQNRSVAVMNAIESTLGVWLGDPKIIEPAIATRALKWIKMSTMRRYVLPTALSLIWGIIAVANLVRTVRGG